MKSNNLDGIPLRNRFDNMFSMNSILGPNTRQDFYFVTSFLKRLPQASHILQPCSTSASANPKQVTKSHVTNIQPLPVQPLQDMLLKYVRSIKPFVDEAQFRKTKDLVEKFCSDRNTGLKLQALLEERAANNDNWLSDWWLNTAYLEYRFPVVVYSSPGLVWPSKNFQNINEQIMYAASVIREALMFNRLIEEDNIPEEVQGKPNLLCMSQYKKIFGTCRIPKAPRDELRFQDLNNPSTNIIIMYNNHVFSIPAFENNSRQPLSIQTFYKMLQEVVKNGEGEPGPGIGVLTSEHRDNWAKSYEKLKQNAQNRSILEDHIEKALFVVCLDKPLPFGSGYTSSAKCSKLLIHGFGFKGNAGNRWFDKTIQFVIGAEDDGVGICYEHSPAEGGPIGVLTNYVVPRTTCDVTSVKDLDSLNCPKPLRLNFALSECLMSDIEAAGKAIDRLNEDLDVDSLHYRKFGKNVLKSVGVSPDGFVQVAIQCAFYRLHNHPGAQYESGSLRKYINGRTDTIRTCSEEVVHFCKLMANGSSSLAERETALRSALTSHSSHTKEVINGRGIDRHLLGLKLLARMNNMEDPEIFSDVAYKKSTYFQLSTSNVPVCDDAFMVYGPLVDNGYACCYNIRDDAVHFGLSAWSTRETYLNIFKRNLSNALDEMKNLAERSKLRSRL